METIEEKQKKVGEWQKARLEEGTFLIAKHMFDIMDCGGGFHQIPQALFKGPCSYLEENDVKVKSFEDGEEVYDDVYYSFVQLSNALFKVMDRVQTIDAICESATGKHSTSWFNEMEKELNRRVNEKYDAIHID